LEFATRPRQLAFERQEASLRLIQPDYWSTPLPANILSGDGVVDRRGLTGSARLLRDLHKVDAYAFETRQRHQALTLNFDLAEMFPLAFQAFRETGFLDFTLPIVNIEDEMPGYYLALIRDNSVSVVALVDPTRGLRARLTFGGISRTVVRTAAGTFELATLRGLPESMALTAARSTSSGIELQPEAPQIRGPFDGAGLDAAFQRSMPTEANPLNYNSIATVVVTAEMTALHDPDYEARVLARRPARRSVTRVFDIRDAFPGSYYDLNNPDQSPTPMLVRFETQREDFPPNLSDLTVETVVLYVVRKAGARFEQEIRAFEFSPEDMPGQFGGAAATVAGKISTRAGYGAALLPIIGLPPVGRWHLAFPDDPPGDTSARDRFSNAEIESVFLALTVSGATARP
ncbi:hypothetical protein Q5Y75_22090, partial [Ruegeria sp. 2205SS24-7]|uniref:Tc toxin subunit A-related protein n=1 Tax=Ruegeria discodermiae TaxID=3064389 RepID=UPI002741E73E